MKRVTYGSRLVAVLGVIGIAALATAADPPKSDAEAREEAQAANVQLLTDAYRLADFADEHSAPEAYIAAGALILKLKAETRGQQSMLDAAVEVEDEKGQPIRDAKVETEHTESLDDIAQGFFDSASQLGTKLKKVNEVEALIRGAKNRTYKVQTRGAVGGPKVIARVLRARQTHVYNIPFDTYSLGSIGFQASRPTRCKMQNGGNVHFNQVVRVGQYTWKPGPRVPVKVFRITVTNPHNYPVTYRLFTN